jgi:4-phospho-D-threonate 3-dehydrogenase / 4-phospho-D-erythronate 3-dehydrogenase
MGRNGVIGVTMGDGNGVGPEIVLRAALDGNLGKGYLVYGDYDVLEYCRDSLGMNVDVRKSNGAADLEPGAVNVLDASILSRSSIDPGTVSAPVGAAAVSYVEQATRDALAHRIDGIVTLPLNKEAARFEHHDFTGHTEFIADICGADSVTMMLASENLVVTHVSTHVSLATAISLVRKKRILDVIRLTDGAAGRLRSSVQIAVAGLNPHAGEGGAFGREELDEIIPAIEDAKSEGIDVTGPEPPDTVFYGAARRGRFDAVVCMYHDQGHIAMKTLDFDGAVNVTLGLPIVRTSVDHGTAYDIAYTGKASTRSFELACEMAMRLVE